MGVHGRSVATSPTEEHDRDGSSPKLNVCILLGSHNQRLCKAFFIKTVFLLYRDFTSEKFCIDIEKSEGIKVSTGPTISYEREFAVNQRMKNKGYKVDGNFKAFRHATLNFDHGMHHR